MSAINLNEVSIKNISNFLNIAKTQKNTEFELKIRSADGGKSTQGVSADFFENTIKAISGRGKVITPIKCLISYIDDDSQARIKVCTQSGAKATTVKEKKVAIKSAFIDSPPAKLTLSTEENLGPVSMDSLKKLEYKLARFYIRKSIQLRYWRGDCSAVNEKIGKMSHRDLVKWTNTVKSGESPQRYEIEIEFTGGDDSSSVDDWIAELTEIFTAIYSAPDPDDSCIITSVFKFAERVLGESFDGIFSKLAVDAVPLKFMNYKHLIENKGDYIITEKIDGLRTVLYAERDKDIINIKLINTLGECQLYKIKNLQGDENPFPLLVDGELYTKKETKTSLLDLINKIGDIIKSGNSSAPPDLTDSGKGTLVFAGFDTLVFGGKSVVSKGFSERHSYLVDLLPKMRVENKTEFRVEFRVKDFYKYSGETSANLIRKEYDYNTDGLIVNQEYGGYYNYKPMKWKPKELTTIDFLCRIISENTVEKTITLRLYTGISRKLFENNGMKHDENYNALFGTTYTDSNKFPVAFIPRGQPANVSTTTLRYTKKVQGKYILTGGQTIADDTVVEFAKGTMDSDINRWIMMKPRPDKTKLYKEKKQFGNNFMTAISNWLLILRPISVSQITLGEINSAKEKPKQLDSFKKSLLKLEPDQKAPQKYYDVEYGDAPKKSGPGQALKYFHGYIKGGLYMKYAKCAQDVLELGGGRANDLNRWLRAGIKGIVLIDISKDAIDQGVKKTNAMLANWRPVKGCKSPEKLKLVPIVGDIFESKIIKLLKPVLFNRKMKHLFDTVFSNFSFHYFFNDEKSCMQLLREIYNILKTDGHLVITAFDGRLVLDYLIKNNVAKGESIAIGDEFKITRYFEENELKRFGQKIGVYVASIGVEHEEYLLNFDVLNTLLLRLDFKLVESVTFGDAYDKYNGAKLNQYEKTFSFFNKLVVYKKEYRFPKPKILE